MANPDNGSIWEDDDLDETDIYDLERESDRDEYDEEVDNSEMDDIWNGVTY